MKATRLSNLKLGSHKHCLLLHSIFLLEICSLNEPEHQSRKFSLNVHPQPVSGMAYARELIKYPQSHYLGANTHDTHVGKHNWEINL